MACLLPADCDAGPATRGLRIAVLGPVRAFIDDREVNLGPRRQRAVLAVLAAHANRPVTREALIDAVWEGSPPATAAGSIYTYISGLRRSLASEGDREAADQLLTSGSSGYTLVLEPGALDSDRFHTLCAEALRLRDAQDSASAAAALDEALGLWRGEAFDGIAGHILKLERAHLAERRLLAVEQRARIAVDRGEDGIIAELTVLVHDHPLHEPFHELLMLALHRCGRNVEALDVFRTVRRTLRTELGVGPSAALVDLHRQIEECAAVAASVSPSRSSLFVVPSKVAPAFRDGSAPQQCGRRSELDRLQSLVAAVSAGRGSCVWIDGEAGIGKTALLTTAFVGVPDNGCHLAWANAEELDRHVPLQVVMRAMDMDAGPAAADPADMAQAGPLPAAERIVAQVQVLCAQAPLVLVVDDMQNADDATRLLWDRLVEVTRRLPLLLVAAARPGPNGRELAGMRRAVQVAEGHVLQLKPLSPNDLEQMVTTLVGASLGPRLREILPHSAGNPLCAMEMVGALMRRGVVRVAGGLADIDASTSVDAPWSVLTVLRGTVDFLSPDTLDIVRSAALLGTEFAVDDVVAITGRSPFDLVSAWEEALDANVLVDAGGELSFRHPMLREVLYESIPTALRAVLHRHIAEVLARCGSPATRIAAQLAVQSTVVDGWVVDWLMEHHAPLARRSPQIAATLLRRVLDSAVPTPAQREALLVALVRLDFRHGRQPDAEAVDALTHAADPSHRAEMRHLRAAVLFREGSTAEAIDMLTKAVHDPEVPEEWRTRHRLLLTSFRRGDLTDLDATDHRANLLYAEATGADQPYEAALALQTRWLTNSIRRHHERALEFVDRAMDHIRDRPNSAGLYIDLLDNRIFTLQNLDRLDDAERTLREAGLFAIRHRLPSALQVTSAVHQYWRGRWDDAVAQISAVTEDGPGTTLLGTREAGAVVLLLRGVAGLIAAHRDDVTLASAHLEAVDARPGTDAERECIDFFLAASALRAEQDGRPDLALAALEPLLEPGHAPMMLRHQWLPDLVRLALANGYPDIATRATAVCHDEARKEATPARAYAAYARCQALVSGDPKLMLRAAARYRSVGRIPELAAACEDAAVLLAVGRQPHEAATVAAEAVMLWTRMRADWDLVRLHRRLSEYGIDPAPAVA